MPLLSCEALLVPPFHSKPRDPDLDQAIQAVLEARHEIQAHDAERRAKVEALAHAIRTALDKGATLAELGGLLGVSTKRVSQLAQGK